MCNFSSGSRYEYNNFFFFFCIIYFFDTGSLFCIWDLAIATAVRYYSFTSQSCRRFLSFFTARSSEFNLWTRSTWIRITSSIANSWITIQFITATKSKFPTIRFIAASKSWIRTTRPTTATFYFWIAQYTTAPPIFGSTTNFWPIRIFSSASFILWSTAIIRWFIIAATIPT